MTHPDPNHPDLPRHVRPAPAKGHRVADPEATLPPSREDEARDHIADTWQPGDADPATPVTVDDVPTDLDDPLLGGM